jgi:AraC-like DNA-binding protein
MKAPFNRQVFLGHVVPDDLLQLFSLLPDVSFFMKDRQGRFVSLNRRGCDYCGVTAELEAIGKTDRDFFPAVRAREYMADDRAVMSSGKAIINRIEPAPESAGSPRLVVTSKIPLRDANGKVVGVAGVSRRVEQVRTDPAATERLGKAVSYLHEHCSEQLSTADLAKIAGLSVSQFERTFKRAFGTSPRQYLLRIRIEGACQRLIEGAESIASIALECAFYDQAHFTRKFTTLMGMSPSKYRRERR